MNRNKIFSDSLVTTTTAFLLLRRHRNKSWLRLFMLRLKPNDHFHFIPFHLFVVFTPRISMEMNECLYYKSLYSLDEPILRIITPGQPKKSKSNMKMEMQFCRLKFHSTHSLANYVFNVHM